MRFALGRGLEILLGSADRHTPIECRQASIHLGRLPAGLAGIRLAIVSDLHYGRFIRDEYVRRVVETVNAARVDVVCLVGDLIEKYPSEARRVGKILQRLRARLGVFGCLGNHEHFARAPRKIATIYRHYGVDLLINQHRRLTVGGGHLVLAGVDDLRKGRADTRKALAGVNGADPVVLMAHSPDQAEAIPDGLGVDLILSGHTHGGQVVLGGRALVTHTVHKQYTEGLSQGPRCPVYVTRGVGTVMIPIRVNCRPEIAILRLE